MPKISANQILLAANILAQGFVDDPMWKFILPKPQNRLQILTTMMVNESRYVASLSCQEFAGTVRRNASNFANTRSKSCWASGQVKASGVSKFFQRLPN